MTDERLRIDQTLIADSTTRAVDDYLEMHEGCTAEIASLSESLRVCQDTHGSQ